MITPSSARRSMRSLHLQDELQAIAALAAEHGMTADLRARVTSKAISLIEAMRNDSNPGLMEVFLAEYGLSTDEGVALMCLAEALLRVPDAQTINELIEDKIAPSSWGEHLGKSSSSLVNASTWALMLTGKVLKEPASSGLADTLHVAVKRLGEPVIRTAVRRAMKEMGQQFVLGQTIDEAVKQGRSNTDSGYTYSYDMLGEAALTADDAKTYFTSYADAITRLGQNANHHDIRENAGISIKLSALHPRYEVSQKDRVMSELVPRTTELAIMAKNAGMGLNIDAEEAGRLDLSLDVIEAVLRDPRLAGWDGFGVVVQAYGKRAPAVIDWLHSLAVEIDRNIMVRLVKGAYWDTEIKQAQVEGFEGFPVYTNKSLTDVSYICCARKLLDYSDRIYPQFATHNAHSISAILEMASHNQSYEFQRLHGMGEALHDMVKTSEDTRCRIYAPVGAHKDLLAYLVRRLLENGANSSFVNQIVDLDVEPAEIAADPFDILEHGDAPLNLAVQKPYDLFQPERPNSLGWDLRSYDDLDKFAKARDPFKTHQWHVRPIISGSPQGSTPTAVFSPNDQSDALGTVALASPKDAEIALKNAGNWTKTPAKERRAILSKAADLYEENAGEIFAALCREAGKTAPDAVAEIREAVDFLRFYAQEAVRLDGYAARGVITCISPWNFPLAIFSGQISAALAAGNGVIAKPADPTPIVASIGIRLMHQAGVPENVLQLVPGEGATVGVKITTDPRINGICFTGSTGVAQTIYKNSAKSLEPDSTFIAETGGLNAMIVDSTALPEQAVQDIVDSAFRSAGQRCSALRVLYLQKDIADEFMTMLYGAMDELELSHPWNMSSDVGPIINEAARSKITAHIQSARQTGHLLKQMDAPKDGFFVGPAVIQVNGIEDLASEIFGPVLHVATFEADELDQVVRNINDSGYGLTFGLHTRIDDRVEYLTRNLNVGNMYVNRNQIGAVVGSQPFGGEGLSGTGPKAGGSHYVKRFKRFEVPNHSVPHGYVAPTSEVQNLLSAQTADQTRALEAMDLPGPTGESNRWTTHAKGTILCLGPTADDAKRQMKIATSNGCVAVGVAPGLTGDNAVSGVLARSDLENLTDIDAVALWSDTDDLTTVRTHLSNRDGAITPLIATNQMDDFCVIERHLCIDTTAAGGNASLLAAQS